MNEEEKKAILIIKKYIDNLEEDKQFFTTTKDNIITIYNLVKKQQKEIEELRNEVMEKELMIAGMKEDRRIAVEEIQEQYFVSKEESEQKEKKAYIDGTNVAHELCNKMWKNKIKAKIEEIIKEGNYRTADNPNGRIHFQKEITDYQIEVLQSLLEKE